MNDIVLPKELAESNLNLEEIGAIFVLYSLLKIGEHSRFFWGTHQRINEIGENLVERGILKFSKDDDNENIMEIDLTKQ